MHRVLNVTLLPVVLNLFLAACVATTPADSDSASGKLSASSSVAEYQAVVTQPPSPGSEAAVRQAELDFLAREGIVPDSNSLNRAVYWGRVDQVRALLQAGVDPNQSTDLQSDAVPLGAALVHCHPKSQVPPQDRDRMLDMLFEAGANPNTRAVDRPLLISAAQGCNGEVVKRFLEAGADLEARNVQGYTPLSRALTVGNLSAARVLVRAGARLSLQVARRLSRNAKPEALRLIRQASR